MSSTKDNNVAKQLGTLFGNVCIAIAFGHILLEQQLNIRIKFKLGKHSSILTCMDQSLKVLP